MYNVGTSLRYITCSCGTFIYCNMVAIVAIINTCITLHNHFFLVVGIIKVQSLNKSDDYNAILFSYSLYCALDLQDLFTTPCKFVLLNICSFPHILCLSFVNPLVQLRKWKLGEVRSFVQGLRGNRNGNNSASGGDCFQRLRRLGLRA